jgi:hypothetical protein
MKITCVIIVFFDKILITLGINLEGVLVSFEMVKDQCIINNRLETFKS